MLSIAASRLSVIVFPLLLALFPAALLSPVSEWLTRHHVPPAGASLLTIVGFVAIITGGVALLAPQVVSEAPGLAAEVQEGAEELQELIEGGIFGWQPTMDAAEMLEIAQEQAIEFVQTRGVAIAATLAEGMLGVLFALLALFFYLKDGTRITEWLRSLAPESVAREVEGIGDAAWETIGHYFRGQLFVAFVDAFFIGLGLWLLGVPLVLPLAVLVFFGSLFPIIGAFLSGAVAVLVALAAEGFGIALATLAVVVAVQQFEGNVLAPVVLGRATSLHPLAVIIVLTAGGVLLGVIGAFLAVPVAASVAKAVGIVRARNAPAAA